MSPTKSYYLTYTVKGVYDSNGSLHKYTERYDLTPKKLEKWVEILKEHISKVHLIPIKDITIISLKRKL